MDQLPTINQIMEATGQKSEAPIIWDLVDEALACPPPEKPLALKPGSSIVWKGVGMIHTDTPVMIHTQGVSCVAPKCPPKSFLSPYLLDSTAAYVQKHQP